MLLACDVIKELTGVAPIGRFPLGGSLLLQFHNVDFQAAFVVFPLQTGIFEVGKQPGGPKFSGKKWIINNVVCLGQTRLHLFMMECFSGKT